jgi:serine/threonine protein phosphatase 1
MRTLIIGDIHGCHDELMELFDRAALGAEDRVVSVGDLVDRGPQPAEVVAWFRARPGSVVLMGNHERKHVRQVFSYSQEVTRLQMGEAYADAVAWMKGLPYYWEIPEIRAVHAALVPGLPLAEQEDIVLAGTTSGEAVLREKIPEGWWHERYDEAVPVAFGHHVVGPEPLVREGKIYGLDTGACHGMRLTALSVPDFTLHSVPAREDHWKRTARAWQLPILKARPWGQMAWRKIAEALDERADDRVDTHGVEVNEYLASVRAWSESVHALVPRLHQAVVALAERLRAEHGTSGYQAAASAHPAKPLLFLQARGKLTIADVEIRCPNPDATLALAQKLGVAT